MGGKILITVMLIYGHWVIMAYSEKLSDIIVWEKCEVYATKKANISFALALTQVKKEPLLSQKFANDL